ncbi:hypothetical protein CK203_053158 [Vitis vinifera]|uniref:Uncharacterized protein n=1 Tax=Vitis vinifera TaxID=29760 RepID=A0A438GP24_VITVI|nr:hypothetical protein CK203_053158 [Vitis vinifera]
MRKEISMEATDRLKETLSCVQRGEDPLFECLFHKLVAFRSFIEMPMLGFEKDVMSLLRKMEARREYRVVFEAKRKSIGYLDHSHVVLDGCGMQRIGFQDSKERDAVLTVEESTSKRDWKPSISGMQFEMLGSNDPRKLEAPISEKESNLCRDKPRSNGFTVAFREMSWDFIKTGMMGFFRSSLIIAPLRES